MDIRLEHNFVDATRVTTKSRPAQLGFAERVVEAFSFLLDQGFEVTRRDEDRVRFESENVIVSLAMGRLDYVVDLRLRRIAVPEVFDLFEVLQALAPERLDTIRCQVTTVSALERCLTSMASAIREEAQPLLDCDEDAFARLAASAEPGRREATIQAQFGAIVDRADQAWEAHDREKAAQLYASAEPALDDTRRRRLAYMRKRTDRPGD